MCFVKNIIRMLCPSNSPSLPKISSFTRVTVVINLYACNIGMICYNLEIFWKLDFILVHLSLARPVSSREVFTFR